MIQLLIVNWWCGFSTFKLVWFLFSTDCQNLNYSTHLQWTVYIMAFRTTYSYFASHIYIDRQDKSLLIYKFVFNRTFECRNWNTLGETSIGFFLFLPFSLVFLIPWNIDDILPHRLKSSSIALFIIFQSIKHLLHQRTLYQSQSIHLATIFSCVKCVYVLERERTTG